MPDSSPRLALPFILPAQAQKHVTHNEAIERLDALVQLVFEGVDADTPPGAPIEGETWGIGAAPTGLWENNAGDVAAFHNGGWIYLTPAEGWLGWDKSADTGRVYTGTTWAPADGGSGAAFDGQNLSGVGIQTSWDATNRLAVASDATLLNNAGTGHQLKINKASAADTASLLFQTGFSGRAEMGTSGNDDFAIKVSPDGASFTTALALKAGSGVAEVRAISGGPHVIANDAATLISTPTIAGFALITVAGSDPRHDVSAIIVQDTGPTPGLTSLFATPLVDILSGVLTGTSSNDGSVGVSAVTGGLWIENRLGSSQSISITFLGGL